MDPIAPMSPLRETPNTPDEPRQSHNSDELQTVESAPVSAAVSGEQPNAQNPLASPTGVAVSSTGSEPVNPPTANDTTYQETSTIPESTTTALNNDPASALSEPVQTPPTNSSPAASISEAVPKPAGKVPDDTTVNTPTPPAVNLPLAPAASTAKKPATVVIVGIVLLVLLIVLAVVAYAKSS